MAVLMLYLNSLYLLNHPHILSTGKYLLKEWIQWLTFFMMMLNLFCSTSAWNILINWINISCSRKILLKHKVSYSVPVTRMQYKALKHDSCLQHWDIYLSVPFKCVSLLRPRWRCLNVCGKEDLSSWEMLFPASTRCCKSVVFCKSIKANIYNHTLGHNQWKIVLNQKLYTGIFNIKFRIQGHRKNWK
jgi:hypothetical protein